jgi:hypothetical protein
MEKKTNKYHLALSLSAYANGETTPAKQLELEIDNHDELFEIIDRMRAKALFADEQQATEFAIGLKLFTEVMLKNRQHPLFEDFQPAVGSFMKKLKSL